MPFTSSDIIRAVRQHNYPNDPTSGLPYGVPFGCTATGGDGVALGFVYVEPAPNTVLEIQAAILEPGQAADATPPESYWMVIRKSVFGLTTPTITGNAPTVKLQDPAGGTNSNSMIRGGHSAATNGALTARLIKLGNGAGLITFPEPLLLFADSDPTIFAVLGITAARYIQVSVYGREWPLDPNNY